MVCESSELICSLARMGIVIPPLLGPGHSRVMSWVVEEAPEFFQTPNLLSSIVQQKGPGGDMVARM